MDAYREVCFHEASHFVFNRLLQSLNIGFPETTGIMIHNDEHGEILGSWLDQWDTGNTYGVLKELGEKPLICKVSQIIYLIAGFLTYQRFVDQEVDKCKIESMIINNRAPSDFRKVEGVLSLLFNPTKEYKNGLPYFESRCIDFLNIIKKSIEEVMYNDNVRVALEYTANYLFTVKGDLVNSQRLEKLKSRVDGIIDGVDMQKHVEGLIISLEENLQR